MKWVDAKKKLPIDEKWIVIYYKKEVCIGMYSQDGYFHVVDKEFPYELGLVDQDDVTHWKCLPKPPKQEP